MAGLGPICSGPVTQEFGPPAPSVAAMEPLGYCSKDAGGWWEYRASAFPGGIGRARYHTGRDIGIPVGTPILAPERGRIVNRGIDATGSRFICLKIDGQQTVIRIDHLSAWVTGVVIGTHVVRGQKIAYSGRSGKYVTGPHAHWDVRHTTNTTANPAYSSGWPRYNPKRLRTGGDRQYTAWIVPK